MYDVQVHKMLSRLLWCVATGGFAIVLLVAADVGRAQDKKAPPRWSVVKVEFKGADTIADPPAPGKKGAPVPPKRQFEFGKDGGKVVKPGMEKETPYITIGYAADQKPKSDELKIIDGLGQELATPSQVYVGRNNQEVLVFKRDSWKQFGELYLSGPGDQKIGLSKFLPVEDQAARKLTTAKLLADGQAPQVDQAKELCQQILKQFPKTKSAKDAKQLLETLKQ